MMNDFLESEEFIGALNAHSNARTVPVKESIIREIKRMIRDKCSAGWQPIDTAPKDGTSVLLCKAIDADGRLFDYKKDVSTAQVFVQVAAWWGAEEEWIVYQSLICERRVHFDPTHWMPLPDAPKE